MALNKQKITPFLWFNNDLEEAINFYTSIFKDSKILDLKRINTDGTVITATFQLEGQKFFALNGGPQFKFTEAISLFVDCETQQEVDELWAKLLAGGGQEQMCGWLKDRFGLSWQIIPSALGRLIGDKDPEKAKRVMKAMLKMVKIDIKTLELAYEGKV